MGEFIEPPAGCYFIRGIKDWKRDQGFGLRGGEISVSLHRDGHTVPFRDYGFVISIEEAGLLGAYPADVTSRVVRGHKEFSRQSDARQWPDLKHDLDALIEATPPGKHNELFVDALLAEIVGVFTFGPGPSAGRRAFLAEAAQKKLPLHQLQ